MNTIRKRRTIRMLSREETVHRALGKNRRVTTGQSKQAFAEFRRRGWITPLSAEGGSFQLIPWVHLGHPLSDLIREYLGGVRAFSRGDIERCIGRSITSLDAGRQLARAGLAMKSFDGDSVRLEATEPREARYVNTARYGAQPLGAGARKVVEAVMQIGNPRRSRINLSENRRLEAALHLESAWAIRCEDLVNVERRRVRLVSSWTFDKHQRSPHVSPTKTTGDLIERGLETREFDNGKEAAIPWHTD